MRKVGSLLVGQHAQLGAHRDHLGLSVAHYLGEEILDAALARGSDDMAREVAASGRLEKI